MKIYVQDKTERTADGEKLQVVQTYESKPKKYQYLIFLEK